jgi:hypothetical protein
MDTVFHSLPKERLDGSKHADLREKRNNCFGTFEFVPNVPAALPLVLFCTFSCDSPFLHSTTTAAFPSLSRATYPKRPFLRFLEQSAIYK